MDPAGEEGWVEIAVAVQRNWKEAFEARDLARLKALYSDNTAFYGSTEAFYSTPDGVQAYFEVLPPSYVGADYGRPHVVVLGPDAIAATGEVVFFVSDGQDLRPLPYRMTHVLVRTAGRWRIATHHASPRPPPAA